MFKNFENLEKVLAHTKKGKESENLVQHSQLVLNYFLSFEGKNKKIKEQRLQMWEELFGRAMDEKEIDFLEQLYVNVVTYHDIGKINQRFQIDKMNNPLYQKEKKTDKYSNLESDHSIYSAVVYLFEAIREIQTLFKKKEEKKTAKRIALKFAYIISKHHGSIAGFSENTENKEYSSLRDFSEFVHKLQKASQKMIEYDMLGNYYLLKEEFEEKSERRFRISDSYYKEFENKNWFLQQKILFGFLVTADFYATYQYMSFNDEKIESFVFDKEKKEKFKQNIDQSDLYKSIISKKEMKIEDVQTMNDLRSVMANEVYKKYNENKDKQIFFLEAPTGSGKTFTSMSLAKEMIQEENMNKIMYVFPFNALIEQTHNVLKDYTKGAVNTTLINSVTSEFCSGENAKEENYKSAERLVFDSQMMRYELVLTSHVRFFEILFGTSRISQLQLENMQNAVIIIDEVQSYKIDSWEWFVYFLNEYAKIFNWKVLIMSATLPPLDDFLNEEEKENVCYLLENEEKYFKHEFFKDRVKINFDYLKENNFDEADLGFPVIKEIIKKENDKAILIEIINKKKAKQLYKALKNTNRKVYLLDGDSTKSNREAIINLVKERAGKENIIFVATQVIEAGVDIDFPVGIKDVSLIESEEQFFGRINRSNKSNGIVYMVNVEDERKIYRGDKGAIDGRIGHTINQMGIEESKRILENKEFKVSYYKEKIFKSMDQERRKEIERAITRSDFKLLEQKMKQIDNESISFFLLYDDEYNKIHTGEILDKYEDIVSGNYSYAEKQVKLDALKQFLERYTFNMNIYSKDKKSSDRERNRKINKMKASEEKKVGMYYYIELDSDSEYLKKNDEINNYEFDLESYLNRGGDFS